MESVDVVWPVLRDGVFVRSWDSEVERGLEKERP